MLSASLRLFEYLILPSNLLVSLGLLGILVGPFGWRRSGRALVATSVGLLAICGWSPLASWAVMALEDRFPAPVIDRPVTGIVLLGGAVDTHISRARAVFALNEAGERLTAAADLSRRYPDARIFLSGGSGHAHDGSAEMTESDVARDLLVSIGVAPERIEMEERSHTTCENASESAASIHPKQGELWLLITSASHMPRAMACYRHAGFAVVAYPVDFRTRGQTGVGRPFETIALGLSMADVAAHEWVGLLAYWVSGKTDDWFPAP